MSQTTSGHAEPARVRVAVARPYDVIIGPGLLDDLHAVLPCGPDARRAAIVTVPPVAERYADTVMTALGRLGLDPRLHIVPDGEPAKRLRVLGDLYDWLASIPVGRRDLLVALGGGVVGDLAGFAAATWNRGVDYVQLPTTLLAQVDAAIGGKTGINLAAGKNLVGAFHQPLAVIADTATLATLPEREVRSGLAEVVKCGFIADPVILDLLERSGPSLDGPGAPPIADLVSRSVAVKARIVAADEREDGQRALLNYGHTLGHAVETLTGYEGFRHGEAVALGMLFAALVGERIGVTQPGLAVRTRRLLEHLGLPTGGVHLDRDRIWSVLGRDKKAWGALRLVLCERPGSARVVAAPSRDLLADVLDELQV